MKEGRNAQGQFTKGHTGYKPKGAVSRKKLKLEHQINLIFAQLAINISEDLQAMNPRQRIKLFLDLNKMIRPKLKRVPYLKDSPQEV